MKLARLLTIAAALAACAARAEDAKPPPNVTQTSAPPRAAATKPIAPAVQGTVAPAAAPVMSESKFLGALYTAIAKRTPTESPAGDGKVTASFHVNAQGKIDKVTIDKVTIDKATSPALAETVKRILSSVEAPPPPGGSYDGVQSFRFR